MLCCVVLLWPPPPGPAAGWLHGHWLSVWLQDPQRRNAAAHTPRRVTNAGGRYGRGEWSTQQCFKVAPWRLRTVRLAHCRAVVPRTQAAGNCTYRQSNFTGQRITYGLWLCFFCTQRTCGERCSELKLYVRSRGTRAPCGRCPGGQSTTAEQSSSQCIWLLLAPASGCQLCLFCSAHVPVGQFLVFRPCFGLVWPAAAAARVATAASTAVRHFSDSCSACSALPGTVYLPALARGCVCLCSCSGRMMGCGTLCALSGWTQAHAQPSECWEVGACQNGLPVSCLLCCLSARCVQHVAQLKQVSCEQ